MRKGYPMLVALVALTSITAACSSDESPATDGGTTSGGSATITVALKEFTVTPSGSSAAAGKVTFAATNNGTKAHELVVLRTDIAPDTLVVADNKVSEDAAGITLLGEIEEFDPGKTETKTFDMTAGRYVLICNIVGHYTGGMRAAFTVS